MTVNEFVANKILEKDRENLTKTKRAAMDYLETGRPLVAKFEQKIQKYCNKYGLTRGEVIASILSDTVAASTFAKSANRQRTAEKAQLEYLQKVRGVRVKRLPSSGHDSIRLENGELVFGATPRGANSTKSFDAVSDNHHTVDYIYMKYTCGSGGSQDNQATDAIRFLDQAHEYVVNNDDRVRFVAILDGDYYRRHRWIFDDYCSERVLVETSDTYKVRGRKAVYTSYDHSKAPKVKTKSA